MPQESSNLDRLTSRFRQDESTFTQQVYNEDSLRTEFLNPLFELLGWDVSNAEGKPETQKDVAKSESMRTRSGIKIPDYSFRVGGVRRFFVEAKKPAINLLKDPEPSYQLRRYAWNAKLPLSILTNFRELAIYDTRILPLRSDSPAVARVAYYTYDQFSSNWTELSGKFSRESVIAGSFDAFAEKVKTKKGSSEVDEEFLKEIERWRVDLARNIALRNPGLSVIELNYCVQLTVDRLLFLRVCEDRGTEGYEQLRELTKEPGIYPRFMHLCHLADGRYNSGLFHFSTEQGQSESPDHLTPTLTIDDLVIRKIVARLYYPRSPYEFSVVGSDILGSVYERFLGKIITITSGHRARVEDRPEVRKAGGVFFTPQWVVDWIVNATLGPALSGKTPEDLKRLHLLDPACGSGSFLIAAYKGLLDYHLNWYVANNPKSFRNNVQRDSHDEWQLTSGEKKRILVDSIFGVDIDFQAVEVAKLNLLLKVLEGDQPELIDRQLRLMRERALPDLGRNLQLGNTLVGPSFFTGKLVGAEELNAVKPFDWKGKFPGCFTQQAPGFEVVIGNPPYGASISESAADYFQANFHLQDYQLDSYMLFVEKSLRLLRPSGRLGMIIPNTWLLNLSTAKIRRFIFENSTIESVIHFQKPVFKATVDTEIVILRNEKPDPDHGIQIAIVDRDGKQLRYSVPQTKWIEGGGKPVNLLQRPEFEAIADKMRRGAALLDEVYLITQGAKPFQVGKGKPPQTRRIVEEKPYVSERRTDPSFRPLLRGSLMNRYEIIWDNDYWIKLGDWLAEPRYSANYDTDRKLVVRQTGDSIVAALDTQRFVARDNLYTIVPRERSPDLGYLCALLNSKLMTWFYRKIVNPEEGEALAQVKRGHLAILPIIIPEQKNVSQWATYINLIELANQIHSLKLTKRAARTPTQVTMLEDQENALEDQIDQLVFALYGLAVDEIELVTGKAARA